MAPSTTRSWPLMKEDSSLARNTAACAMSSGRPARGIGWADLEDLAHHGRRLFRGLHRQAERLAEDAGRDRAGRNRVDADVGFAEFHCHAFGEMDDGGLRRAIDHRRRKAGQAARDAAVVDDAAGTLFPHMGRACFMPSITLRTSVAIAASKRSTSRPSMPPVCAGPPALLNRQSMRPNFSTESGDQRLHLRFHRDVGLAKDAVGAELFGQRLALRRAAPGDDDFRAFGDEYLRGAQSDAARRTGDHRYLAVQPSHVVPPVDIS